MSEAMQANEAQTSDCSTPFPIPWRITQVRSLPGQEDKQPALRRFELF